MLPVNEPQPWLRRFFPRLNPIFRSSSKETLLTRERRIKEQILFRYVDKFVSISLCNVQALVSLKLSILVSTTLLVKMNF